MDDILQQAKQIELVAPYVEVLISLACITYMIDCVSGHINRRANWIRKKTWVKFREYRVRKKNQEEKKKELSWQS